MDIFKDKGFRYFSFAYLGCYILLSTLGALWISDEFDYIRGLLYGLIVPAAIGFYFINGIIPDFRLQFPRTFYAYIVTLILTFGWGNLLLLNAIGRKSDKPIKISLAINETTVNYSYRRGGFGWLYRFRF